MNNTGPLSFEASLQDVDFNRQIAGMERRIVGMSNRAVSETQRMDQSFQRLGQLAAGYFTFSQLSQLPDQIIRVRGEFQQLETFFTKALGSKAKAEAFLAEGAALAAKSTLELSDVAKGQKVLLAYGFAVESIIPTMTRLGDIAAGTGANFNELVSAYGQIKTQGTAQWEDIMKFLERGVNIVPELAAQFKIAESDVKNFVAQGKVGFPEVEKAIQRLTDGTGKMNFGGLMAEQSKTLTGLVSNLSDAWTQMLNNVGADSEGVLGAVISGATDVVKNYQPVLDVLTVLVATYGAYRTALIAVSVAQAAATAAANVRVWVQLAGSIKSAADAQALFNLTTKANPYVLAATALIGLITAVALYRREATAAEKATDTLNKAREAANTGASSEIAKIELLKTQINSETLSRETRNQKLRELIALSPQHLNALTLENLKTSDGTTAINGYIDALKKKLELQEIEKELTDSINRQRAAKNNENDLSVLDKIRIGLTSNSDYGPGYTENANRERNRMNRKIEADEEETQRRLKARVVDTGKTTVSTETSKQKAIAKTVDWYEEQIKSLKDQQQKGSTTRAEFVRYQKQIDALDKQRRGLTGEKNQVRKRRRQNWSLRVVVLLAGDQPQGAGGSGQNAFGQRGRYPAATSHYRQRSDGNRRHP